MPVKYFCDTCGKETDKNYSHPNDTIKGKDFETDIYYCLNIGAQDVVCKRCLVKVLRNVVRLLTEEPKVTNPGNRDFPNNPIEDKEDARS